MDLGRYEEDNRLCVAALLDGASGDIPKAVAALESRLRGGADYGAGALLREVAAAGAGQPDLSLVHARTRAPLLTEIPPAARPVSLVGARLVVHRAPPTSLTRPAAPTVHAVNLGPLVLPFRLHPADSDSLIVTFHAATDRAKIALPRFERLSHFAELGSSLMAFSDPTLDLRPDLALGWYLGSGGLDLTPVLAGLVAQAAAGLGARRVVLFGSSGGGFAALAVGAMLDGPTVIAVNPQTDISKYYPGPSGLARRAVFGDGRPARARLNLVWRYRANAGRPRIRLFVNSGDKHHLARHATPFVEALKRERPDVDVDVTGFDAGPGHHPPPSDDLRAAAVAAAAQAGGAALAR
ncbi:MAG: hypothetical protein LBD97_10235 [Bifidobacteriaceae bacterium]|nr:hypothetical protein [Bifidobacteriaceae bacterium]